MRQIRLPILLCAFAAIIWSGRLPSAGIPFNEWVTPKRAATETHRVHALRVETPANDNASPSLLPDLRLTDPLPPDGVTDADLRPNPPPPPEAAIEDVCVAMAAAAQIRNLPVGFFARLIWQESRFDQRAVSRAGALGVAQFMPDTAAWIGLQEPFDAIAALPASARFLEMLHAQFGNLGLAAAAYNAGPGRLQNWLSGRGPLPEETRTYVRNITGHEVEKWLNPGTLDLALHLPARAPCEGLAGLSRKAEPEKVDVRIEPAVAKLIETARAEAAARLARKLARTLARKGATAQARQIAGKREDQKKASNNAVKRAETGKPGRGGTAAKAAARPMKLAGH
jgi:hypothetical protein